MDMAQKLSRQLRSAEERIVHVARVLVPIGQSSGSSISV